MTAIAAMAILEAVAIGGCAGPSGTASPTATPPPARAGIRPDLLVDRSTTGPGWHGLLTADGRMVSLAVSTVPSRRHTGCRTRSWSTLAPVSVAGQPAGAKILPVRRLA
jgi:hypothetical protein